MNICKPLLILVVLGLAVTASAALQGRVVRGESVITDGFVGGAGTEGGARVGSDYILQNLDSQEPHIIEHEVGHGLVFPDYYTDATDCPAGNCANLPVTIMNAGASMVITDWDKWSLRAGKSRPVPEYCQVSG